MKISMTDEQFEHAHRLLWLELARTGKSNKAGVSAMQSIHNFKSIDRCLREVLLFDCFACGASLMRYKKDAGTCAKFCPVDWGEGYFGCCEKGSPYYRWEKSHTIALRKHWAGVIARLPWRREK